MLDFTARRTLAGQLRADAHVIAEAMTDEFLKRHPDWIDRYGHLARTRGLEDAHFHIQFLVGALLAGDPALFARYATWTARVLSSRGIGFEFLRENLEQLRDLSVHSLDSNGAQEVARFVDTGVAALGVDAGRVEPAANGDAERALYLQAVLNGDRQAAFNIAQESLRCGDSVVDVYQDLLQPAQYEIGRLWENNTITVAREHAATAVTQYVVARLYDHLTIPANRLGNALVTGVRGELHQLGANMVADVLEADGWNVRFLGTQLPHRDILQAIDEHQPRVVGISAALVSHLEAVGDLIADLRASFGDSTLIVVGGAAFRFDVGAWRDFGADGLGNDLREAREVVRRLTTA